MDSNRTALNATDPTGPSVVSVVRPDLVASPVRRVMASGTAEPGLGSPVGVFPNRPVDGAVAIASIDTDTSTVTVWLNEDGTATLAWCDGREGASEHPHLEAAMRCLAEAIVDTCDAYGADAFQP